MHTTTSNICPNCNTENEESFKYCPSCGQKNTDSKITFWELWFEFQDAVFNIESRTWRTLKDIFIPGKLTVAYFEGKRQRYVHPLRLLLVSSILVIISMSFQDFQSATNHNYDIKEWILKNYERQQLYGMMKNIADSTNTIFPTPQTKIITDTMLTSFKDSLMSLISGHRHRNGYGQNIDLNHYASFGDENMEIISKRDFLNMSESELVDKYKKDAGFLERHIFKQKLKMIKDESKIFATIIGNLTWAVLLMMPCLALVLYLLNIRHNYYYIEHLIFTFHLHAFAFLVIAFLIVGLNVFPWWVFLLFAIMVLIYTFISMWKVYQQSIGKTVFKFLALGIVYIGLLGLFFIGIIISSFILL